MLLSTKTLKEFGYSYSSMNVIYAEENPGNSDNQSLLFMEDDNTQHSSSMMFASPHSLISHLSTFWKSRNYPLTVLASPVAAEIITKKVWTANKVIVLKVMLTDVKLITIHVVRLTGVTTLDLMPESTDQAHPLTLDRRMSELSESQFDS